MSLSALCYILCLSFLLSLADSSTVGTDGRSIQGGGDAQAGNAGNDDRDAEAEQRDGSEAVDADGRAADNTGGRHDDGESEAQQRDGSEAVDADGRSAENTGDRNDDRETHGPSADNTGDRKHDGEAEAERRDGSEAVDADGRLADNTGNRSNNETDARLEQSGQDELMDARVDSGEGEDRLSPQNSTEVNAAHTETPARFVAFSLRLNNMQYSLLAAEPSMMDEVKVRVADKVANNANVPPEAVEVDLRPGSVIAKASIYPPSGVSADAVQQSLSESPQMRQEIADGVSSVPGIDTVMTGNVTVTLLSDPVVHEVEEPIAHAHSSRLSVVIGSLAGGVAMLLCM